MSNKKKQFDQEFKQNAVNYCLTHPELSRKECAKNLGIGDSTLYRWKQEAKANNNILKHSTTPYEFIVIAVMNRQINMRIIIIQSIRI